MESSLKKKLPKLSPNVDDSRPIQTSRSPQLGHNSFDNFAIVGSFLQQPTQFFQEIRAGVNLSEKIWTLLISSIVFLAIYGVVLGVGHPLLSLDATMAIPFLFVGSLVTCVPVMYLLDVLSGSQRSLAQMVAILLTSMCAAATVFFSFSPVVVLFRLTGTIPQFLWLNIGILALATLVGLIYVTHGLIQTASVDTTHLLNRVNQRLHFLWMLLFLMVISQLAWSMLTFYEKTGGFVAYLLYSG